MANGTINDITNLKFYTDKGYEIPLEKQYILTWEIIPVGVNASYVTKNPSGYFIGDVDFSDPTNIKIEHQSLIVGVIEHGEVFARYSDISGYDENDRNIFQYSQPPTDGVLADYIADIILNPENQVKVSININGTSYTSTFELPIIFDRSTLTGSSITRNKVYIGNNTANSNEYYENVGISSIDLIMVNGIPYIQQVFEAAVPNIGMYFPFIRYSGSFTQDTVSSGFIAANTIVVLEEVEENNTITYQKPFINSNNQYSIVFSPTNDGELKLIDPSSLYDIKYTNERAFYLADKETSTNTVTPLTFAVAVQAEVEGVYQNFLGLYIKSVINPNVVFFMGCIVIKTQVEGEDERFRTLLGNFGVVDPIKYSNLFAEQDYQEQGKDFTIINKKSKELMLTYDQIFSYIGTYKALLRAIKFLGYNDIIFKEWYTLKDSNDVETDIAIQVFDTESGKMLKQKLADFGVSIEDFKAYNKINRLSMIYHLNEIDDSNYEYIDQRLVRFKKATYDSNGNILDSSTFVKLDRYTKLSEVPLTKPIYEYRNEETLAKLFGVKHWLETNVIGVNAYISDISGEGVYFGWQKSQTYATQHYLTDYSQQQYYTADVKNTGVFNNSETNIRCTLTELNNGIKFCDYEYTTFEDFVKFDRAIGMKSSNGVELDVSTITISNTIEAPVLGDEYEFELSVQPPSGTLYEWTVDGSSQILYNDNTLNLLFEQYSEAAIDSSCLPIITLEKANIHKCFGEWKQNIEWSIKETVDQETGNVKYRLKNFGTYRADSHAAYDNNYFVLVPSSEQASIKYTEQNKYHLPLLVIKGYEFDKTLNEIDDEKINMYTLGEENEYIIEILKGDIWFKRVGNVGATLSFSDDISYQDLNNENQSVNTYQQMISLNYTYNSDKVPFTMIDTNEMQMTFDTSVFDYKSDNQAIDDNVDLIEQYYQKIVDDRKDFIKDPNNNVDNVALADASQFIGSQKYFDSINDFISKKKEQTEKSRLYQDFLKIYNDNYTFNQYIDTSVNRLGKYQTVAKAYDKYNNIFVSKYPREVEVIAKPISIDTYTPQKDSHNNAEFYRYNMDGVECDSSTIQEIIDNSDVNPLFPKSYHINDFIINANNTIEFDNLSYAIPVPNNNDYVIFENLSEICAGAEESDNVTHLSMLDENPKSIYLYNPSTQIKICIYDKMLQRDYINIGPFNVIDSSCQDALTDTAYQDDSYINIDASIDSSILDCINDTQKYVTYVLNVTEHKVKLFGDPDPINNNTRIYFESYEVDGEPYQVFNNRDVIKIRYYINNESVVDSSTINETTYRIISVDKEDVGYVYTIYGLINEFAYNDPDNYTITMSLANHSSVHYVSRVVGDAQTYNYSIGNGNYALRYSFKYDPKQMLINYYIDDTYSGIIYDYDAIDLKKTWFNIADSFDASNMDLYYYHEFPITVPQGRQVVFHHHDIDNVLLPGYHVQWKVSSYTFDDIDNWLGHKNSLHKTLLYRSVNDYLSIKPEFLSTHDICLECIDRYGNKVVNQGSGYLCVTENRNYTSIYETPDETVYVNDIEYEGLIGF